MTMDEPPDAPPWQSFDEPDEEPAKPARKPAKDRRSERIDNELLVLRAVERINRDHALVLIGDRVVVLREGDGDDGRPEVGFMTPAAFRLWFGTESYWVGGPTRSPIGDLWLSHPQRRQFQGLSFAPEGAPAGWYNLWKGPDVKPVAGDPLKAFPRFHDHLLTNIAGGDEARFRWIVGWFAHMAQHPAERLGVALVLRGKMGTGKTKVGEVFGSLWPRHYLLVDDPRYIVGQFNAHLAHCLLLQADEGFWAGDKNAEGRLKGLITSSRHMIERKGVDPVPVRNLVRLLVTSNSDWVVPAGMEERRFAVFDVGDAAMQNAEYFAEIDREMAAGGRAVLLHWLLNFDLSGIGLRSVPATPALFEQKIASLSVETAWWLDRLRQGSPYAPLEDWPEVASIDALYGSYIAQAERIGVRRRASKEQFGMLLGKLVPERVVDGKPAPPLVRTRPWINVVERSRNEAGEEVGETVRKRVHCYVLPRLEACRAHLEGLLRTEIDWLPADEEAPA